MCANIIFPAVAHHRARAHCGRPRVYSLAFATVAGTVDPSLQVNIFLAVGAPTQNFYKNKKPQIPPTHESHLTSTTHPAILINNMRNDYKNRRESISAYYKTPFEELLRQMYIDQQMSAIEISEHLWAETGNALTPRSIQRHLKVHNLIRTIKDAFNLADRRGRVQHVYKSVKYKRPDVRVAGLRHKILTRDGFKCTLCGNTAEKTILEMDHIVPICRGGLTNEENMRTLCYLCNAGKRINENER